MASSTATPTARATDTSTPTGTPPATATTTPTEPPGPKAGEMSLTIKEPAAACDDPFKPTKCNVPLGSPFVLSVQVNSLPVDGTGAEVGYVGMQTMIVYGGLVYKPVAIDDEIVWPDSFLPIRFPPGPTGSHISLRSHTTHRVYPFTGFPWTTVGCWADRCG